MSHPGIALLALLNFLTFRGMWRRSCTIGLPVVGLRKDAAALSDMSLGRTSHRFL